MSNTDEPAVAGEDYSSRVSAVLNQLIEAEDTLTQAIDYASNGIVWSDEVDSSEIGVALDDIQDKCKKLAKIIK